MPQVRLLAPASVQNVRAPHHLAGGGVEAAELASGAERVHQTVMPGGCGPGALAAAPQSHQLRIESLAPRIGPELAARLHVVGGHDFVILALLDRERAAAGDGERRAAAADRLLPHRREPVPRPHGSARDRRRRDPGRETRASSSEIAVGVCAAVSTADRDGQREAESDPADRAHVSRNTTATAGQNETLMPTLITRPASGAQASTVQRPSTSGAGRAIGSQSRLADVRQIVGVDEHAPAAEPVARRAG